MKPFLKWAGSKRQLLPELVKSLPEEWRDPESRSGHYYEPFLGGGALFFDMRNAGWDGDATLGDSNSLLIRTYLGIRNDVEAVIEDLEQNYHYSKKAYYFERDRFEFICDKDDDAEVAAWFIYINRTCFNGLWRVNQTGKFNVPMGAYKNPTICDAPNLRAVSEALRHTKFLIGDFERTVKSAETGDLVYFDPPYVPASATSNFTGYDKSGFGLGDQGRLRDLALRLKERGVHVILSNSDTPDVRALYKKGFQIRAVEAKRSINSKASKRGKVGEVIIT